MMPAFTTLSGSVSNVCGWILKDLKLTAFVLSLMLFSCSFEAVNAVLPSYIPALGIAYYGRDSLVQQYFHLGLNYVEIISFLLLIHGINLSLRQLKRILRRKGLTRRQNYSDPAEVVAAVGSELQGSGSLVGYRQMHQRLRTDYGLVADRETVRTILKTLDPDGVERRSKRKLKRRKYHCKGPNYIWHIDGYDKLKPFGFCIHGAIDGYSRRILWLEVGSSNNNPRIVGKYFLDCVAQVGGTPRICRGDAGTENVNIAAMQRFFRRNAADAFRGDKSFLYGKSVSNQRIEGWWSFLRKSESDWWISFFKDLRDGGLLNDDNYIQMQCLKFCFMPVLRAELQRVAQHWNLHKIRPSKNEDSPAGRPDVLYFIPEADGKSSYLSEVPEEEVEVAMDICCEEPEDDISESFRELARILMNENDLRMPTNAHEGANLYCALLCLIDDI